MEKACTDEGFQRRSGKWDELSNLRYKASKTSGTISVSHMCNYTVLKGKKKEYRTEEMVEQTTAEKCPI